MTPQVKKYIIYAAIVVVLFIVIRFAIKKIADAGGTGNETIDRAVGAVTPVFKPDITAVDREKAFAIGTNRSNEVAYLQNWLNGYFQAGLKIDGAFGPKTHAALLKAIPNAGIGPYTLNKLKV